MAAIGRLGGIPNVKHYLSTGARRARSLRWRLLVLLVGTLWITLCVTGPGVFAFVSTSQQRTRQARQTGAVRGAPESVSTFSERTRSLLITGGLLKHDCPQRDPMFLEDRKR